MLEMYLFTDSVSVNKYAAKLSVSYGGDYLVYVAKEGVNELGFCLFETTPVGIRIIGLDSYDDPYVFDGLIRAAMSTLFDKSEDCVEFSEKINKDLLEQFGYSYHISSANTFFITHKNCKK